MGDLNFFFFLSLDIGKEIMIQDFLIPVYYVPKKYCNEEKTMVFTRKKNRPQLHFPIYYYLQKKASIINYTNNNFYDKKAKI